MRSTLRLSNLTVLDAALLFYNEENQLQILGISPYVNVEVTGNVIGDEQVVVDFSKLKKRVKDVIDDKEIGLDHKTIILRSSDNNIDAYVNGKRTTFVFKENGKRVLELNSPSDATHVICSENVMSGAQAMRLVEKRAADLLTIELNHYYPGLDIAVKCTLHNRQTVADEGNAVHFEYAHGLRESSSWGCQNVLHGHRSIVSVEPIANQEDLEGYCKQYADDVAMYLWGRYICNGYRTEDAYSVIEYTTGRGYFRLDLLTDRFKVLDIGKEPTIENILEHVLNKFPLKTGYALMISEGIQKGAVHYNN